MRERAKIQLMKILNLFHFHKNSNKNDIFIFSTFRSGSTWLSEIIESQPKIKFSGAPPLSPDKVIYYNKNKINKIKPRWQYFDLNNKEKELVKDYITKIKNGDTFQSRRYGNLFSKNHDFITNRSVIRYLRSCALIEWFNDNFNDYIIFLIRHPIPTSLSRLKIWNRNNKIKYWEYYVEDFLESDYYKDNYLTDGLIDYINYKYLNSNDLEKFVISWCLEILPVYKKLSKLKTSEKFIMLTYEEMVLNSVEIILFLYNKLELESIERMKQQLKKPSTTVKLSDKRTKNKFDNENYQQSYLIKKWKEEIEKDQEKKIFDIIDKFNIDIYKYNNFIPHKKYFNFK